MSGEDTTQNLPSGQNFETRVLAALSDITTRLERLEAKQYDTKPIWERALAEITEVRQEVAEVRQELRDFRDETRRNFKILNEDIFNVRSEQRRLDDRQTRLEGPTQ